MAPGRSHAGTRHRVAIGAAGTGSAFGTSCLWGEAEEARSPGQGVQRCELQPFSPAWGGQGVPGGSARATNQTQVAGMWLSTLQWHFHEGTAGPAVGRTVSTQQVPVPCPLSPVPNPPSHTTV